MDRRDHVRQLTLALASVVEGVACGTPSDDVEHDQVGLDMENSRVEHLLRDEIHSLVEDNVSVRRCAARYAAATSGERVACERALLRSTERTLRRDDERVDALWTLLTGAGWNPGDASVPRSAARASRLRVMLQASRDVVRRQVAAVVMLGIILGVLAVAAFAGEQRLGQLTALEIFVIWALSFMPGWMFVRFIGFRAGALWDEYVLNLHRLGIDEPEHLPRPPAGSSYAALWRESGGPLFAGSRNIYRQKFDAYYGKDVSRHSSRTASNRVSSETLFPVFLTTAILAVAWTTVLWGNRFLPGVDGASWDVLDAMVYGFIGAYFFAVQMLVRRYFQSDLKASAYASIIVRIVTVLLIVAVVNELGIFSDPKTEAAVAFLIGVFPLVGIQVIQRVASGALKVIVPTLQVDYPLSDLQGLNIWYEARLLEEGIEDMQNLVTANVVDVMLHTRVPVGRLVDWQDQAQLYLRLPPRRGRRSPSSDPAARSATSVINAQEALRWIGVTNATSFIEAFPVDEVASTEGRVNRLVTWFGAQPGGLDLPQIETMSHLMSGDSALDPVRNWRGWQLSTHPRSAVSAGARGRRAAAS